MSNALQCDSESLLDQAIFETSGKSKCWRRMELIFCSGWLNFILLTLMSVYIILTMKDLSDRVNTFDSRIQNVENQMLKFQSQISGAEKSIQRDKEIVENDKTTVEADTRRVEALTNSLIDLQRNISSLYAELKTLQGSVDLHSAQIMLSNLSIVANQKAIYESSMIIEGNKELGESNQEMLEQYYKLIRDNLEAISSNRDNISSHTRSLERDEAHILENTEQIFANQERIVSVLDNTTSNTYLIGENEGNILNVNATVATLSGSFDSYLESSSRKDNLNGCYYNSSNVKERYYVQSEIFLRQPSNETGYVMVAHVQRWTSSKTFNVDFVFGSYIGVCTGSIQEDHILPSRYTIRLTRCGGAPHYLSPCESDSVLLKKISRTL